VLPGFWCHLVSGCHSSAVLSLSCLATTLGSLTFVAIVVIRLRRSIVELIGAAAAWQC